jgi:hypothetical protein
MVATRAMRSAILIGREAWTLNGQIGNAGNGIIIGADGITITGADRSDLTMDDALVIVEAMVDATPDNGKVTAAKVTFGEGQIRRFRIIA